MSKDLAKIKTDLDLQVPTTKLNETVFHNRDILEQSRDDIIKYELSRFLGERETVSKEKIEKKALEIENIKEIYRNILNYSS